MTWYQKTSLSLVFAFSGTGLLFLFMPNGVIVFFNQVGTLFGAPSAPLADGALWHALACAYMYVVTFLALAMMRRPTDRFIPLLLANAKAASALFSFIGFLHTPYFILVCNTVVDTMICVMVLRMRSRMAK